MIYLAARLVMLDIYAETNVDMLKDLKSCLEKTDMDVKSVLIKASDVIKSIQARMLKHRVHDFNIFSYRGAMRLFEKELLSTGEKQSTGLSRKMFERPQGSFVRQALALTTTIADFYELYNEIKDMSCVFSEQIRKNAGIAGRCLGNSYVAASPVNARSDAKVKMDSLTNAVVTLNTGASIGLVYNGNNESRYINAFDSVKRNFVTAEQGDDYGDGVSGTADSVVFIHSVDEQFGMFLHELAMGRVTPSVKRGLILDDTFLRKLQEQIDMSTYEPNDREELHVEEGINYYMFGGAELAELKNTSGEDFRKLYLRFIRKQRYTISISMSTVVSELMEGFRKCPDAIPQVIFKDSVNNKTNLSNRGVVVGSDIDGSSMLFNNHDETAVNFTAGINIAKYYADGKVDFDKLAEAVRLMVDALNTAIDVSNYPTPEARKSALDMRPIGIGMFNLSGLFAAARLPFECLEAQNIAAYLCEFIYYHALTRSVELAKIHGPYSKCGGSDFSKGIFQHYYSGDSFEHNRFWNDIECCICGESSISKCCIGKNAYRIGVNRESALPSLDWTDLSRKCRCYGTRNSQVTSQTSSSTACVLGAFEPQEARRLRTILQSPDQQSRFQKARRQTHRGDDERARC
ncbi:hypothetical protein EGW08_021958 [Elysia chlorotica]|uniref:Ribonucleotide reductase large subunit C-terminal domain-containing protein n=1 Tax=Elysia chlorotica TaxID=188477 RepID=A0A433SM98_ELYCH|nr:hypothetical protein EGW08_021958 [Elysia chlorotica]